MNAFTCINLDNVVFPLYIENYDHMLKVRYISFYVFPLPVFSVFEWQLILYGTSTDPALGRLAGKSNCRELYEASQITRYNLTAYQSMKYNIGKTHVHF